MGLTLDFASGLHRMLRMYGVQTVDVDLVGVGPPAVGPQFRQMLYYDCVPRKKYR